MGYSAYGFPCEFQILECSNTGKHCCAVYRFYDLKGLWFDRGECFKETCELFPQEQVFCFTCFLRNNEKLADKNKKSWASSFNLQYHIAEFDCREDAEEFADKKGPQCLSCCNEKNFCKILLSTEYDEKASEIRQFFKRRENKNY